MPLEARQAIERLHQAEQNFNYATGKFVDVAILELMAAEKHVDLVLKTQMVS